MHHDNLFPQNYKVLFCVLNWGLGHATRSIPLIQKALDSGCTVYVASDGIASKLLEDHFHKSVLILPLPSYDITYNYESIFLNIILQLPKFTKTFLKENKKVTEYIKLYDIDMIVSDNRFGCFSKKIRSVYITHQLTIDHAFRWIGVGASWIHSMLMKNYNEIWVPDFSKDESLAGKLAQPSFRWLKNIRYIGPLSRLRSVEEQKNGFSILILLSGPEPQRSYLECSLASVLYPYRKNILFVRGTECPIPEKLKDFQYLSLAKTSEVQQAISNAHWIICRSGYTTIMDLAQFKSKNIIFVPTPGQTEQEYLGRYHQQKSQYVHLITQNRIAYDLETFIKTKVTAI